MNKLERTARSVILALFTIVSWELFKKVMHYIQEHLSIVWN